MLLVALLGCGTAPLQPPGPTVTWDADVTLDTDYTVPERSHLVIEPGVTVTLGPGVALLIDGFLEAQGTTDEPIVFTGSASEPWRSIVFSASSVHAEYTNVDDYAGGSVVRGVVVENATRGLELAGGSPYVADSIFRRNTIPAGVDTIGGAAILVSSDATPRIRGCSFEGNVANTFAFGGAIYVNGANPILQGNTFAGNMASYGGAISTDNMASPFAGNTFMANESASDGGAVSLVSSVSALLNNRFTANHSKADGGGIHVCLTCDPHAAPTLVDNVIVDNLSDNADPADGSAGIGASFLGGMTTNDIHGNLRDGEPSDFSWYNLVEEAWPTWAASPDVGDNYWGTTDAEAIAASIFDGADDPTYTEVDASSVRDAPIGAAIPRVVIATRRMHYQDAGDAMEVYLTLYNPGLATSVTLDLRERGRAWSGSVEYSGATASGGIWTLDMPEDSVWFATIEASTYDGVTTDDIEWTASLSDAASGARIGRTSVARYLLAPADGT